MAEKRMISKTIIDNDVFYELPLSAQALYFHVVLNADDDGFTGSIIKIMRTIGAKQEDLDLLLAKRYLLDFPTNTCICVKHWKCMNSLPKDRYKKTTYQEEYAMLDIDYKNGYTENKSYFDMCNVNKLYTKCIQNVNNSYTECLHSIVKNRLDKIRLDYIYNMPEGSCNEQSSDISNDIPSNVKGNKGTFTPPTLEDVTKCVVDNNYNVDPNEFISFYESKGWMVGKNKMKNWKSALAGWNFRNKQYNLSNSKVKKEVTASWQDDYQKDLEEQQRIRKEQEQAFTDSINVEELQATAKEVFGK